MTRDTTKDLDPATTLRKADRAADRVVARPDGYYWVADDGEQEFGPYATAAAAMLAHAESIEGAVEEARALEEAEAELGVAERQDRDLIEAEEQPFVAGEPR
jgi:hypothetical protein